MSEQEPLLKISGLSVAFRSGSELVTAISDVDIDVAAGETVALVGQSGSGKSTTGAATNRLLPDNGVITGGSIRFDGKEITDLGEHELIRLRGAGIGLVPQDPMSNLDPVMRVGDQIAEALEVHGYTSGAETEKRAIELLDMVGIADAERRFRQYPHEFSGGMRQRVLIAIGLACRPRLLIADEPTSALDVTVQRKVLDQLESLTDELGTAVILITHDLALAAERADRIVVMHNGRVVETGPSDQVLSHPEDDYTKELIAAAPSLASKRELRPRAAAADERPAILVEATDLTKVFPVRAAKKNEPREFMAVDKVSFQIPASSTVSLVGESGSGKSTTANMLLGLETITSGTITFEGTDLTALNKTELFSFRRKVQPVFQNPYSSLDPRYTIEQTIAEPMRVHGVGDKTSRRTRVLELLDQVALPASMAERLPHELSGGQRQRVAIARALALNPELVVLDEAVSALDVLVQAQILKLLADLQADLGLSYLFISHDLAVVRLISDEVHVMQHGTIVESGTPEELFEHPQHPYTQELLAAIPGRDIAA
ncbi:ABC transporter ATP-binding protein [Propionimicrobium sp. PCR01-08-3]|uniref:ABC transporter ATP-binding protein n=1 Tax=Propionimicrobium sp. PCR01-08-3 TaxID=3052086 RepID=UPI00255C6EED|nr:ABC transporter ATP-binding protein [Propionimicrobium sp. PCR01-08-3]WIY82442.1 ABC transporter ATP-binding protein [Propionimicrobium sp. PCR01-08-3]